MDERAGQVEPLEWVDDADDLETAAADGAAETGSDDVEATRAEIEQTRAEMADTIEAIKEKLSPDRLVAQAKETVRDATVGRAQDAVSNAVDTAREAVSNVGGTAREAGSTVIETIQRNPMPAALAAIGIGWLYMNVRRQNERQEWARRDAAPRYTGAYSYAGGEGQAAGPYTFHPASSYSPTMAEQPSVAPSSLAAGVRTGGAYEAPRRIEVRRDGSSDGVSGLVESNQANPLRAAIAAPASDGW